MDLKTNICCLPMTGVCSGSSDRDFWAMGGPGFGLLFSAVYFFFNPIGSVSVLVFWFFLLVIVGVGVLRFLWFRFYL